MLTRGERAKFMIDEGNELVNQIVGVAADRRRVDVLIAAHAGEAVGEYDDARSHPALVRETRCTLGNVLVERPPIEMRETRARIADQIEQYRIALAARARSAARDACVVSGRQPDAKLANVRIRERIAGEDLRVELEHHRRAGRGRGTLACHRWSRFSPIRALGANR